MSRPNLSTLVVAVGLLAGGAVAAGCSDSEKASDAAEVTAGEVATADVVIIDVRTADEFAQGHLEGAINLDVEGGAFEAGLAELDPGESYAVYCRSGNRSAAAARIMAANGFTDVADLGSLDAAASSTGLPVTTG